MKFTDISVKNLKPQAKKYYLRETNGLTIRVMPSGIKTWLFIYPFDGKRRELNLGHYREDGSGLTLSEARSKQRDALKVLELGKDPSEIERQAKEERSKAPTVSELVDEYLLRHAKKFKRSWQEDERILKRDVVPSWGKRKAADIRKRDINLLLEKIMDRGAPVMANNTFKIVRKMFNYAVEKDILPYSPAAGIKLPAPKVDRDRALTEEEVMSFWRNLDSASMTDDVRRALKLVLVTAQRPNEVAGMHVAEIHGRWWTIPAERSKNGRAQRVYLTDTAIDLIGEGGAGYVFPCPHKSKEQSLSRHALSRAIANNCPSGCVNDCCRCSDSECLSDGRKLAEKNRLGISHCTPHDLRRTAATFMAQMGVMDEVIDAVLNHVKQGVIKVYNQYRYDKEKQQALEAWERKLLGIVTGKAAGKVMTLTRKQRA